MHARMMSRRFTQLTTGFLKKQDNFTAVVSLFAASYGLCWSHSTLKGCTPALVEGIAWGAVEGWRIVSRLVGNRSITVSVLADKLFTLARERGLIQDLHNFPCRNNNADAHMHTCKLIRGSIYRP